MRKATGNQLIKIHFPRKTQGPVSDFCCVRNRVCLDLFVSSTIPTSPNISNFFLISVYLEILPSFTDTFTGIAFRRSGILFLFLCGVSASPETQLIYILSKFHCLIYELYLTNHHSSQEHAIYGTFCIFLAFLNPTTCYLSNLRSINLIWSLSPLSCSLSSFFLCWASYRPPCPFPNITH